MTRIVFTVSSIFLICFFRSTIPFSQIGDWRPGLTHRPRILFTASDTTDIINRIANDQLFQGLFNGLYNTLSQAPNSLAKRAQVTESVAFVYAINRKPSGNTAIPLTVAEREALKQKVGRLNSQTKCGVRRCEVFKLLWTA